MPKKAPGNRITNFLRVTRLGLTKHLKTIKCQAQGPVQVIW